MTAEDSETKIDQLVKQLNSELGAEVELRRPRRLWASIEPEAVVESCKKAYNIGFCHLSTISVTDWLEEGKFEVLYHLWSYEHKCLLTLKAKIDRNAPSIDSVNSLWGTNAETCERECHEMFGIEFKGNQNLTPLFLEDWQGPPPFRKDFDWREYVRKEFYHKDDPRERAYFEVRK